MEYGCGQCMPCRVNRRRVWTGRLMLEASLHASSAFLTLTYDQDHVPSELVPRDLQLFLKRLRKRLEPQKVRYYAVGEYGDISGRPHFHLVVFGLGGLVVGRHNHPDGKAIKTKCECVVCKAWPYGSVHVGEVTPDSAGYTVQYVTKAMTRKDDVRLQGRRPEFARMSLRPGGLGAGAVQFLVEAVTQKGACAAIAGVGTLPGRVRAAGRMWPLGRYLLGKFRADYGVDAEGVRRFNALRAMELQAELREPGARAYREQKRIQAARIAYRRDQITRSKKGVGV